MSEITLSDKDRQDLICLYAKENSLKINDYDFCVEQDSNFAYDKTKVNNYGVTEPSVYFINIQFNISHTPKKINKKQEWTGYYHKYVTRLNSTYVERILDMPIEGEYYMDKDCVKNEINILSDILKNMKDIEGDG